MIKDKLKDLVDEVLKELGVDAPDSIIEHPRQKEHGDYSTSAAFVFAKKNDKNPKEVAQSIVSILEKQKPKEIEKIEILDPGFINFHLSRDFFADTLSKIDEDFGDNKVLKGQKVTVEYTDPNPFKVFHIGHLMSNAIGESISRIIEASSAKVHRVNYQGDVGMHVAKSVWGMKKMIDDGDNVDTSDDLGRAYAVGAKAFEEDAGIKNEITLINKSIYNGDNESINALYKDGKKISLDYFETIYKKLGTKFDHYFFESESAKVGKGIVEKNLGKVFEESDGAIVYRGDKHGLHTRVFINSEGIPTYEAKDIGVAEMKYKENKYDKSIIITGNEVTDYFKVVLSALKEINPELEEKTVHIPHGMMLGPDGKKMSSRTGDVISAESLMDKVKLNVEKKLKDSGISEKEKESVVLKIVMSAIKYSILKQSSGKNIIFDIDKSISFEGDSGPYVQYTTVRAISILKKAKEEGVDLDTKIAPDHSYEIEKMLYRFREVVEKAYLELSPHTIAVYITELASEFNTLYAKEKILDKEDKYSPYKLSITKAVSDILESGLWMLGIEVPERM